MERLDLTQDLAQEILVRAKKKGASHGDVVMVESESFFVTVRLGEVEKISQAQEKGLGLRLFFGHSSATGSTSDVSRESIDRLVQDTCTLARATVQDEHSGLPRPEELARQVADLDLVDREARSLPVEEKIRLAKQAESRALDFDPRITNSEGAEFSNEFNRVIYASSSGFSGEYEGSVFGLSVVPVAQHDGAMQRDYWSSTRRKFSRLDSPDQVGEKAARRVLRRLGARKVATRDVPVVFEPETARSLVGHLAQAVSGDSLYKGASFLIGKLDRIIASDAVTIIDDGTIPAALGSKPFDGEGLATRKKGIVQRGVLKSYLLDTYSGRKLGLPSTGNASRSVGQPPSVAPTNFYLAPGPHSPEAIIASVEQGFYVTELIGFGVNSVTGDYSRGAAGMWIEGGKLAYPVEEITIAGNLKEMFQNIEMVGNDLDIKYRVAAPTVKISRMTVAGD
ncbi:MAG TPA: TldD/PmbA family protein [Candidatus Binatia bacterium]